MDPNFALCKYRYRCLISLSHVRQEDRSSSHCGSLKLAQIKFWPQLSSLAKSYRSKFNSWKNLLSPKQQNDNKFSKAGLTNNVVLVALVFSHVSCTLVEAALKIVVYYPNKGQ